MRDAYDARAACRSRWSPEASQLAYVTADERRRATIDNRASRGHDVTCSARAWRHVWVVNATAQLSTARAAGVPYDILRTCTVAVWCPWKDIAITRRDTATSASEAGARRLVDVATGKVRRMTSREQENRSPLPHDGSRAVLHRRREARKQTSIWDRACERRTERATASIVTQLFSRLWRGWQIISMPDRRATRSTGGVLAGGSPRT